MLFTMNFAYYERGVVILTFNKGLTDQGELLGDPMIATAILDHLLPHIHVINDRRCTAQFEHRLVSI
jgi:hypothetical protein